MARYSTALRNQAVSSLAALFNGGRLQVYTGSEPSSADSAPTGTKLVEVTLPNPAFGAANNGQASLNGVPITATALASGTAGYYRLVSSDGTVVLQGPVVQGTTPGFGELAMDNPVLVSGQQVVINSYTLSHPALINSIT